MDLNCLLEALGPAKAYATEPIEALRSRIIPLLTSLGEPEYLSASRELDKVSATGWETPLRSSLTSLQAAHAQFFSIADENDISGFFRQVRRFCGQYLFFGMGMPARRLDGYRKAMESALVIAVCYRALNDPPKIAEWTRRSVRCFNLYAGINVTQKPVEPQRTFDGVRYEHKMERELRQQKWTQRLALLRFCSDLTGIPLPEDEEMPK